MSNLDSQLFAQAGVVVAFATTGATLLRVAAPGAEEARLAIGLLLGAALTAVDTMLGGGHGLPLAGWALLLFAGIGLGSPASPVAAALAGDHRRLAVTGLLVAGLLHWAHVAMPSSPAVVWGIPWHVLDLTCSAALAWLVWQRPGAPFESRFLLAAVAFGLGSTSLAGEQAAILVAGLQAVGTIPWLLRMLAADPRGSALAAAPAFAVATACALRARVAFDRLPVRLPGFDDPILLLAALLALFGLALLLAPAPRAAPAAVLPPVTPVPPVPPVPHTPPEPAPAVNAPTIPIDVLLHDLRQPLTNVLAATDLLPQGAGFDAQVATLRDAARQLAEMVGDFEECGRTSRGTSVVDDSSYDFHRVLRDCIDRVGAQMQTNGVAARLDILNGTPRWLQGDPARLAQLLTRLFGAAARECALSPLTITAYADDSTVNVVVQNHSTTADAQESLAMLCGRQLAAAIGGTLHRRLRPKGGIELHLALAKRLAPEWEIDLANEDERAAPASPTAPGTTAAGRVLLVDDNRDHQLLLGRLLGGEGAEVTVAETGVVALHLLESSTFDLVLLDMKMPDKDGYETVAEMRARGLRTPVVALTETALPAEVERCFAAGCNGHLAKPVDQAALRQALAMCAPTGAP